MSRWYKGETWIDREELAYDVPLALSPRRGYVRFPFDGKLRLVRLGVPDTYFTIPARVKLHRKTVTGLVWFDGDSDEFVFVAGGKNACALSEAETERILRKMARKRKEIR